MNYPDLIEDFASSRRHCFSSFRHSRRWPRFWCLRTCSRRCKLKKRVNPNYDMVSEWPWCKVLFSFSVTTLTQWILLNNSYPCRCNCWEAKINFKKSTRPKEINSNQILPETGTNEFVFCGGSVGLSISEGGTTTFSK